MGDVLPLKNNHAVERLSRRVSGYRAHQNETAAKYELYIKNASEHERQNTAFLQQRFFDSKAKKSKKDSRTYKESVADSNKSQVAKLPVKRSIEDTTYNGQTVAADENERTAKLMRTEHLNDKKTETKISNQSCLKSPLSNIQTSVANQLVQQFNQPNVQLPFPKTVVPNSSSEIVNNKNAKSSPANTLGICEIVECKKENETADLVPLEAIPSSNLCDSITDSFIDIEKKEHSSDQDSEQGILSSEIIEDLINDISPTVQEDFKKEVKVAEIPSKNINAEDEGIAKDVICSQVNVPFSTNPTSQLEGMNRSLSCSEENVISSIANTLASVTSPHHFANQQSSEKIQPYINAGTECITYDFDIDGTSRPTAARALKHMAEQHQSSQQQQIFNPSINNRPPFSKDNCFSNTRPPNFLNGANNVLHSNESMAPGNVYNNFGKHENFFPNPINRSPDFEVPNLQMLPANEFENEKPPPYSTTRPLSHYENMQRGLPVNNQHLLPQSPPLDRSKVLNPGIPEARVHFQQVPQQGCHMQNMNLGQMREGENKMLSHPNMYSNYHQMPYSQYSSSLTKPPPEYKAPQHHLVSGNMAYEQLKPSQSMFRQSEKGLKIQSPNVTVTPNGLAMSSAQNWNSPNLQQHQAHHLNTFVPSYNNLTTNVQQNIKPVSPSYNQYRPATRNMLPHNNLQRLNIVSPVEVPQRQQNTSPQCQQSPLSRLNSISVNNSISPNDPLANGPFNTTSDIMNRNDNNQMNLDLFEMDDIFSCIN